MPAMTRSLLLAALLPLAACQQQPDVDLSSPDVPLPPPADASITVARPFTPAAPEGGTSGVFLTLTGGAEADTLVQAAFAGAERVEVHETYAREDGMRGMREVTAGIALPAGEVVALEPGSYHIMLINLSAALAEADTLDLELIFARAGAVPVRVPVVGLDAMPQRAGMAQP
jgi:copper(I)-binding protein